MSEDASSDSRALVPSEGQNNLAPVSGLIRRGLDDLVARNDRTLKFSPERSLGLLVQRDESQPGRRLTPREMHQLLRWLATVSPTESLCVGPYEDSQLTPGTLSMFADISAAGKGFGWIVVGEAIGSVKMSSHEFRMLTVRPEASFDLHPLSALEPDDLQRLVLYRGHDSDKGMVHVSKLTGLYSLDLCDSTISDSGLDSIPSLCALTWLNLACTRVTDLGLNSIRQLQKLGRLNLAKTKVTDEGLKRLAGHTELHHLNLRGTRVSDAGLQFLVDWPACGHDPARDYSTHGSLDLRDTCVTRSGVEWLQHSLDGKAGTLSLEHNWNQSD